MDIAAAVDMERLREIMTKLVERSAAVVQRYGGTVESYTGDGVMALFGAPSCVGGPRFPGGRPAALAIQEEANELAAEVQSRDGLALRLRVGLDSGRVIAGETGSGSLGYTRDRRARRDGTADGIGGAFGCGDAVGVDRATGGAHRDACLNQSGCASRGSTNRCAARQLVAISPRDGQVGRAEPKPVGRGLGDGRHLDAMVQRTIGGRGGVVRCGGTSLASARAGRPAKPRRPRRVEASRRFGPSANHTPATSRSMPVRRLLRANSGVADLEGESCPRENAGVSPPMPTTQDLLLLDDLLGIADADVPLPQIDPDARRRRLTALINATTLARTRPALYIIEDAHWIDAASESMLADFLTVIPRTP